MKRLGFILCFVILYNLMSAQVIQPVKWTFALKPVDDSSVEVFATATMDKGWHIYSISMPADGPVPTRLSFKTHDGYQAFGNVIDKPSPKEQFDKTFGMTIGYYETMVVISQKVKIQSDVSQNIEGEVEYMACNDEQCLAPEIIPFSLSYKPVVAVSKSSPVDDSKTPEIVVNEIEKSSAVVDSVATIASVVTEIPTDESDSKSYWSIFWLAFAGGLAALLTPCVFPMIPMTVSFFTKHSKTRSEGIRNALTYAISIVVIYVILGTVVTAIFGADSLNELSTAAWFNTFFGVLLIVFAISFFGAFELVLPGNWVNAVDRGADKGGLLGSFFMATTLALVSFSCTGPIVGGLIVQAAREGGMAPVIGMLGFSSAIALPFAFFAAFPGYLNSLPKSGGWLNSVKVVLGFVELAFALKFLSMADMILKLGWLPRELFLAIWIVIFASLGFYLLGKIRLPHDSPVDRISVGRFMLAIITLSFTVYLIPGLWGAPVKLVSGFPPPARYSESPFGVGKESPESTNETVSKIANPDMHYGPHGILMFNDYDKALSYAKEVNKPLFIDFTGDGCVNCRKMEDNVWSDLVVKKMLEEDFVVVSLVVDDREVLPENQQYTSGTTGKRIKTVGHKWSDLQMSRYHRNSQPYYVILNHQEQMLVKGQAYDLNVDAYVKWMQEGVAQFKKK